MELEELEERRTNRKIDFYEPAGAPHLGFHKSIKTKRFFIGANRSGKTTTGIIEDIWYATGKHPYKDVKVPNHGWVVSVDFPNSNDVAQRMFFEYMPQEEIRDWDKVNRTVLLKNGSTVGFKSMDSGWRKFQGSAKDWIHFDEECRDKAVFNECMARQKATKPLEFWVTMSPIDGLTYTYEDFYEPWKAGESDDIDVFTASIDDNMVLSTEVKKAIRSNFEGTEEESARIYGRFTSRTGLVYKQWDRSIHLCEPFNNYVTERWPVIRAIDPHPRIGIHVLWLAVSPKDELYLVKEHVAKDNDTVQIVAPRIIEESRGMNVLFTVIDTIANTPEKSGDSLMTMADRFRLSGVPCRNANKMFDGPYLQCVDLLKGEDTIDHGTGGMAKRYRFHVFNTLKEFIFEIEHAVWDEAWTSTRRDIDPKERPKAKRIHMLDLFRYLIACNPHFTKQTEFAVTRRSHSSVTGY